MKSEIKTHVFTDAGYEVVHKVDTTGLDYKTLSLVIQSKNKTKYRYIDGKLQLDDTVFCTRSKHLVRKYFRF